MKKRHGIILLTVMMAVFLLSPLARADAGITVTVNGQTLDLQNTPPYMDSQGRVMVPMRALANALGCDVTWLESERMVRLRKDTAATFYDGSDIRLYFKIDRANCVVAYDYLHHTWAEDSTIFYVIDTAPVIANGTTYIPARYVAEVFGYEVQWDGASRSVKISAAAVPYEIESIHRVTDWMDLYPIYTVGEDSSRVYELRGYALDFENVLLTLDNESGAAARQERIDFCLLKLNEIRSQKGAQPLVWDDTLYADAIINLQARVDAKDKEELANTEWAMPHCQWISHAMYFGGTFGQSVDVYYFEQWRERADHWLWSPNDQAIGIAFLYRPGEGYYWCIMTQ